MITSATVSIKSFFCDSTEFDIDPISVLAIMALHSLREKGTKYQFHKKGMSPQEPLNYKVFGVNTRGAYRNAQGFLNGGGTNCEDINHIWAAYLKTRLIWEPKQEEDNPVYKLIKFASSGLKLIKTDTYSKKPEALVEGFDSWGKKMDELSVDNDDKTNEKILVGLQGNNELCDKIRALWTDKEIRNLNQQIENAFNEETKSPEVYIQLVTTLTKDKFHKYRDLIK